MRYKLFLWFVLCCFALCANAQDERDRRKPTRRRTTLAPPTWTNASLPASATTGLRWVGKEMRRINGVDGVNGIDGLLKKMPIWSISLGGD